MIALEDVERLYDACKLLRDERRKCAKLSEQARNADLGKSGVRANVDLNSAAVHVIRLESMVHAVAVDAGVADLREASHYREQVVSPSAWHSYPWTPALPRVLKAKT